MVVYHLKNLILPMCCKAHSIVAEAQHLQAAVFYIFRYDYESCMGYDQAHGG